MWYLVNLNKRRRSRPVDPRDPDGLALVVEQRLLELQGRRCRCGSDLLLDDDLLLDRGRRALGQSALRQRALGHRRLRRRHRFRRRHFTHFALHFDLIDGSLLLLLL